MIRNTYLFLDGINVKKEQNIWNQGIKSWDDFLSKKKINGISRQRKLFYDRQLLKAKSALYNSNSSYFIDKLPSSETWRLYDFFKEDAVFLDIETSGVTMNDDITVFGLYDGLNTKTMIKGINLDYNALQKEMSRYKLMVTFNGSVFDVPFVRKRYNHVLPKIPNLDLRHICARVGLTGGLKEIEKKLGIQRNKIIERFYGGDAITLWRMFRATGDEYYLNLLVEYNEDDVYNLKGIAEHVYSILKQGTQNGAITEG